MDETSADKRFPVRHGCTFALLFLHPSRLSSLAYLYFASVSLKVFNDLNRDFVRFGYAPSSPQWLYLYFAPFYQSSGQARRGALPKLEINRCFIQRGTAAIQQLWTKAYM